MLNKALITSRDPRGLHAVGLFEVAYNKAKLDDSRAQKLNERGGELQDGIVKLILQLTQSNQFAQEEALSNYTYPKEYQGPKPILDQIDALAKLFCLDPSQAVEFAYKLPPLPEGAEGWFAIPLVDALAKTYFSAVTDPAEKYCQAVRLVHTKIAASRQFHNYCKEQITPTQLRVHARTAHALDVVAETQKGDILIIAAQLGLRHRGQSIRRARETFVSNEFGLGSLAVGSIILTHPERLVRWEELDMDCAGDEFSPGADSDFSCAPCFDFRGGCVRFRARFCGSVFGRYGSASAFLPQ